MSCQIIGKTHRYSKSHSKKQQRIREGDPGDSTAVAARGGQGCRVQAVAGQQLGGHTLTSGGPHAAFFLDSPELQNKSLCDPAGRRSGTASATGPVNKLDRGYGTLNGRKIDQTLNQSLPYARHSNQQGTGHPAVCFSLSGLGQNSILGIIPH